MEDNTQNKQREVLGTVVSDKMQKTGVVLIERKVKHPVYGKYVKKSTKIKFHDELNQANIGDKVAIIQTRPLSKSKSWTLARVLDKSK